jgi:hypothetical protein
LTPTYKKYIQNIGKLFVAKNTSYDHAKRSNITHYGLVMVYGLERSGYRGETGAYLYKIQTLQDPFEIEWRKDYSLRCTEFNNPNRYRYWGHTEYLPMTEENEKLVGTVVDIPEDAGI